MRRSGRDGSRMAERGRRHRQLRHSSFASRAEPKGWTGPVVDPMLGGTTSTQDKNHVGRTWRNR